MEKILPRILNSLLVVSILVVFGIAGKFFSGYLWGYPSDALFTIWQNYYTLENAKKFVGLGSGLQIPNIYNSGYYSSFIPAALGAIFSIFGTTLGYNLVVALTYALNFFSFYLIGGRFLKDRLVSIFLGLSIVSSQYIFWHSLQNIELTMLFWVPPLLYYLFRSIDDFSPKNTFLAGLFFALQILTSFQVAYFVGILICFFTFIVLCLDLLSRTSLSRIVIRFRNIFAFLFSSIVVSAPFVAPIIIGILLKSSSMHASVSLALSRNSLLDLVAYGARPWDYFLPSISHPLFGDAVATIYSYVRNNFTYQYWSTYLPERPNYLTFTVFAFSVFSVVKSIKIKNSLEPTTRRLIIIFSILGILMFLLSLPAIVSINGFKIHLPSSFLFNFFPMFRVYARAGIFVLIALSIVSGIGVKIFLDSVPPVRRKIFFSFIICILLFENLSYPPFPLTDLTKVSGVNKWLRDRGEEFIIVDYPRDNSLTDLGGGCVNLREGVVRDFNPNVARYYQIIHHKELLSESNIPKIELAAIADISRKESYEILRKYRVKYIVVRTRDTLIGTRGFPFPSVNPLDECWRFRFMEIPKDIYSGFKKIIEFEDGVIFSL